MNNADPSQPKPPPVPPDRPGHHHAWEVGPFFFPTLIPLIVGALCALVAWLAMTTDGMLAAIALANRLAPVRIEATGAHGAISREFGFDRLRIHAGTTDVDLHQLRAKLAGFSASPPRFDFALLAADRVDVAVKPGPEPSGVPESIASPVGLSAQRLAVGDFRLDVGITQLQMQAIEGEVDLGASGYRVTDGRLQIGDQQLTLAGRLDGARPFAIDVRGSAQARWQDQPVKAQWQATGSLVDLAVRAEVAGGEAQGQVQARIGSFDAPFLKSLHADVGGIDLHGWQRGWPATHLRLKTDLQPNADVTRLHGTVQLENAAPGPIDAGKLPLKAAHGEIVASADALHITGLVLQLPRGRATGSASATFGRQPGWQADLAFDGIDPAALHARARSMLLDGTVQARQDGGTTRVSSALRNRGAPSVAAQVDLAIAATHLDIQRANLKLGAGTASITGSVGFAAAEAISLRGTVDRLDPSLLVKGADASISGEFEVDARMEPGPAGQLRFSLKDSRALGKPLTGHGTLRLSADQQLDVDLALAARSTTLSAKGGLGDPTRRLAVEINAPHLAEWLPQLQGAAQASAILSGAWNAPAADVKLHASSLHYGEHAIASVDTTLSYSGGADGRIALRTTVAGHAFRANPALSLRELTLAVDGPVSKHAIALAGSTAVGQPVSVNADGGWIGGAWRGTLREARTGAPLNLKLATPAVLTAGPSGFEFGPAEFSVAGASFSAVRLSSADSVLRTSGSFIGLKPSDWIAHDSGGTLLAGLDGSSGSLDPLAFRGQWNLQLGAQADGQLLIERSGGDLYAGPTADKALLIGTTRLEAKLVANRLEATVDAAGRRTGSLALRLDASVEHVADAGWRLARQRPWHLTADAGLDSIAWLSLFMSEPSRASVRFDGRLAGHVDIGGTPAQPQATGTLRGDAMQVAWVDQGLRLEKGQLRARLEDDMVVLDELHFDSPLRVRPKDARPTAKVDFTRDGTVNATGQLRLKDSTGVIQVAAQQLPVLQLPERWLLASGGANISFSPGRVQLNGALAATAGFIDLARRGLPTLSSDVIVRRRDEPAARTPRVEIGFDVGVDLGESLYVVGAGLNTRVEGTLRLRSGPRGALNATGSIESKDGVYEGFGQRLAITRGRLNFQGPIDNPGLDILAIRRGLPMDVGVTITRTATDPLVRLYSDPQMPDTETLSWLVLGRAPDQSQADNIALAQAAASLLSGNGPGVYSRLAQNLGVDEVSLTSSSSSQDSGSLLPRKSVAGSLYGSTANTATTSTEVIRIGKNFGDAVTISYEQALAGTASVVQMSYRLSQRLSLVARAGTENALDIVYTWAFD